MAVAIGEVAAAAGVSTSTVSRCFTTPEAVPRDTRERVLATAEELGYAPQRASGGRAEGRTRSLAMVVPDIANLFFSRIVKAAQCRARLHGYAVFLADTDERAQDEYELALAMSKQVDGLILVSPRMSDEQLCDIAGTIPLVLVNRPVPGRSSVLVPGTEGMWQAVQHLHGLGHRHCASISGTRNSWSGAQRTRAVREACEAFAMRLTEFGPYEPFFNAGVGAADLVVASGATAVIAYNDIVAVGAVARLTERNFSVPGDLSVVGVDDTLLARAANPALTSVRIPLETVGERAADLLLDLLAGGAEATRPEEIMVESELVVRQSTGPVPG